MNKPVEYPASIKFPEQHPGYGDKPQSPKEGDTAGVYGTWASHDPAIFYDEKSDCYYTYSTNAIARRSKDLISWECIGKVVAEPPAESIEWTNSKAIWAPDIIKVGDEYRLYCSNSSWGVQQSTIFLAVADNPEGPFIPRGCVIKTSNQVNVNAIDANLITDEETGDHYMVYGSFWGGCNIIKLDKETGLAAEEGLGKCLARRPLWLNGAIEGPYIRYNPKTGYYYLFVSYGSLNFDYNIRVARSKSVTGPYVDVHGRDMTDLNDEDNSIGFMPACGYMFHGTKPYMGPGHNSVLCDKDGDWYLFCHIREYSMHGGISKMHVYKILWTEDGWPVINPMPYAGEKEQDIEPSAIPGAYERIKLINMLPQGVLTSSPLTLHKEGRLECGSVIGRWKQLDSRTLSFKYGKYEDIVKLIPAWDSEKNVPTLVFTGKDNFGIATFGKKTYNY